MENNQLQRSHFEKIEQPMMDAGFDPVRVRKEISFAIQSINKSAQLQKCPHNSLLQSVLNISNIGLTLNPAAREAYLIPRYNSYTKQLEACLEPSYMGLVKLLTDTGSVKSMVCQLVHAGDFFQIDLANNFSPVIHKPELSSAKRGEIIGVYALATLSDNNRQVEWMDTLEVNEIRARSETYKAWLAGNIKSCTWVTDYGEMMRKTVIKRIYKYLPRTEKMQAIDKAIEIDNDDYKITDGQLDYIQSLLDSSLMDEKQREWLELELPVMNAKRASEVIQMLKDNVLNDRDRVRNGETLKASEINNAVKIASDENL